MHFFDMYEEEYRKEHLIWAIENIHKLHINYNPELNSISTFIEFNDYVGKKIPIFINYPYYKLRVFFFVTAIVNHFECPTPIAFIRDGIFWDIDKIELWHNKDFLTLHIYGNCFVI